MSEAMQLTVTKGPGAGLSFRLEKKTILIGRGIQNDIPIINQDVSRKHARLTLTDEGVFSLEDLDSTNGTFVNGERITQPVDLKRSDVIRLGSEVEFELETASTEAGTQTFSRSSILTGITESDAKKTNVFISYSRKNVDFVKNLHRDLNQQDFKVWVDWEGIPLTADWWVEIEEAIRGADAFIFIISPTSLKSEVCEKELNKAVELNKNIVPILFIEPGKGDTMPAPLSTHNWVYMRNDEEYRTNLPEMVNTLTTDLESVKGHTRLLVRAIEWQDSGQKNSALLRGEDLLNAEAFLAESRFSKLKPTEQHVAYITASRNYEKTRQRRSQTIGLAILIVLSIMLVISVRQSARATSESNNAVSAAETSEFLKVLAEDSRKTAVANAEIAQVAQALAVTQRARAEVASTRAVAQSILAQNGQETAVAALEIAETEKKKAIEEATRARSSQLAAQALQALDSNAPLSTVLTIESLRANPINREAQELLSLIPYYFPPITMFFSGHNSPVTAVDFSRSGRLASGSQAGEVFVWDLETHLPELVLDDHSGSVNIVRWGPNGELASGSTDGTVIIWDLETGTPKFRFADTVGAVYGLGWSEDGRLAYGGSDSWIHLRYSDSGEYINKLFHAGEVRVVKWSSTSLLATGSTDNTAIVWDLRSGLNRPLVEHTGDVLSLSWGPRQQLATGSGDSTIIVWDIFTRRPIYRLQGHTGPVLSLDWSEDDRIVSSSADNKIYVWNPETGTAVQELKGHTGGISTVAWGRSGQIFSGSDDESIIHWDVNILPNKFSGHLDTVRTLAWSDDGVQFASASDDNNVYLWTQSSARVNLVLREHRDRVNALDWSPGNELASASADGRVIVWDLPRDRSRLILPDHNAPVLSVAWGPEGELGSGDEDGKVIVWDVRLATPQVILAGHTGAVHSVAWSPEGVFSSAGEDRTIVLWDLFREEPKVRLTGHTGPVLQIAWSTDGRLASASADGTLILWDLAAERPAVIFRGHTAAVNSLAWDKSGRLLSASDDGSIIYWNVENGKPLRVLNGRIEEITTVAWRPDGAYFASGGGDNIIHVLPDKFLSPPCAWGVRNLNPGAEWEFYFPDQEYNDTCALEQE